MFTCGIDIGGTKVMIGFVDQDKNIVFSRKYYEPKGITQQDFTAWLTETFRQACTEAGISTEQIEFCGMGVPGTVSQDGRVAVKIPNLGWENYPVAAEFEAETGIPAALVQDSRAGAWGEYMAGAGRGYQTVVCITLGTGIGTGLVINGAIHHGALLCAGEIGHTPAGHKGRVCGCGQVDCLEKYAAGGGLDWTARELYGEEATATDLFEHAAAGDVAAQAAIDEAIDMLSTTLIAVVNLLSPDCLLFSGGLSARREQYVEPLMAKIRSKCYSLTGERIHIGLAALGENAPMIGAALLPHEDRRLQPKMTASIMCADFMHLEQDLRELERSGIDYIHVDVMDNHFVPNMMIPGMLVDTMRKNTHLPFDIHIMAEHPEQLIPNMGLCEGDICSVHYESTPHVQRALALVRATGAQVAIAINPGTPIENLRELLPDVDMVLIMTVNPGYSGQKLVPQSLDKIRRARQFLDQLGYSHVRIEVDGCCSFENIPKMWQHGADTFVLGTSSIYSKDTTVSDAMDRIRQSLEGTK